MNEGRTFVSFLASRVANNQCEMCSYLVPPMSSVGRSEWMGYSAAATCPSCGRGCTRLFVEEGANPPERVADDYVTRPHGDPRTLAKDQKLLHPTHPRPGYDGPKFWGEMSERYGKQQRDALPSNESLKEKFPHLRDAPVTTKREKKAKNEEEPEIVIDPSKAVTNRRFKIGGFSG